MRPILRTRDFEESSGDDNTRIGAFPFMSVLPNRPASGKSVKPAVNRRRIKTTTLEFEDYVEEDDEERVEGDEDEADEYDGGEEEEDNDDESRQAGRRGDSKGDTESHLPSESLAGLENCPGSIGTLWTAQQSPTPPRPQKQMPGKRRDQQQQKLSPASWSQESAHNQNMTGGRNQTHLSSSTVATGGHSQAHLSPSTVVESGSPRSPISATGPVPLVSIGSTSPGWLSATDQANCRSPLVTPAMLTGLKTTASTLISAIISPIEDSKAGSPNEARRGVQNTIVSEPTHLAEPLPPSMHSRQKGVSCTQPSSGRKIQMVATQVVPGNSTSSLVMATEALGRSQEEIVHLPPDGLIESSVCSTISGETQPAEAIDGLTRFQLKQALVHLLEVTIVS
ncbi:unnamed protein product [Protopolystoma xenopodis]|uniref:Uncharacterized protein n=1 Tax=Protopolystoma xenopodis TaxID=117903 RepID=A0A3S5ADA3_9PLAT|nr:unnamed protein product [Protopolystoma xenopodis]